MQGECGDGCVSRKFLRQKVLRGGRRSGAWRGTVLAIVAAYGGEGAAGVVDAAARLPRLGEIDANDLRGWQHGTAGSTA
jgi:hypothetical protein